ncbi:phytanoyl-CoA dioxygenase family protein [Acidobacteria bacterium AH-259-D05]|nr:phytanoyl-CoA dioxygenase family protein [Acidobacteria bacterium AH-259-D05]
MVETKELNVDFSAERCVWANELFQPADDIDLYVEELTRNGYTILKDRLDEESVAYARKRIDEIYEIQVREIGGEKNLELIGEQALARNLLAYDDFFIKLARHETVLKVMRRMLGEHFILYQQNGNLNKPNYPSTSTPWHRDLTFRHYCSSRPLALTVVWVIDAFTEANGGLPILPSSHREEAFPSWTFVEKFQQKLYAPAGTIEIHDAMMWHRSGNNQSDGCRRICQHMYTLPMIGQQICMPETLNGRYPNVKEDPTLGWLLGFNSMQQSSVLAWRKEKLENKRKHLANYMVDLTTDVS